MTKRVLKITKAGNTFMVDEPAAPGSPPIGQGNTVMSAIGSWFHNNQVAMNVEFDVTDIQRTAAGIMMRELRKR